MASILPRAPSDQVAIITALSETVGTVAFSEETEAVSKREANEEEIDEQVAAGFIALQNWDGI
jgi:hypothetical protein